MFTFRRDLCLLALLPLSACNLVVSEEPWFSEADAVGASALRDGLWLNISEPDCQVDEFLPAEQWPDCAGASYVRGDESFSMQWEMSGKGKRARRTFAGWQSTSLVLATPTVVGETPIIVQIEINSAPSESTAETVDVGDEEPNWRFWYLGLRETQSDGDGRITAYEAWPVRCGPEPSGPEPGPVTDRPFPGLTIVGDNCTAESAEALRRAAAASESLGDQPIIARWVRDGWR